MKETLNKVDIARAQIEKACELHLQREFICSLTLAGSSESLTNELVQSRGKESGDSWHVKFIRFWREKSGFQSPPNKDILYRKNWARNSVKHHKANEPEEIEINVEFESLMAIMRSIENYQRLGNARTKSMDSFNKRTRE